MMWMKMLKLARRILRIKTVGEENIVHDKAGVFVCNHGVIYGPVSAMLSLPVKCRPWVNDFMLDKESAARTMSRTFENKANWLGKRFKGVVIRTAAGIVCRSINRFNPIPVPKTDIRMYPVMMKESLQTLQDGTSLLIFPERPSGRYGDDTFHVFNTGFAAIGRRYYEETGENLPFYPVYTDKVKHEMRIGSPVYFEPGESIVVEKARLTSELRDRMVAMSI